MGYQYSDVEMLLAAEIAYLNTQKDENIGETVDRVLEWGSCVDGKWVLDEKYANSPEIKRQFDVAKEIKQLGEQYESFGVDWRKWTIVDRCNDQEATGYYGCLIDRGDGSAIIANRGSEMYDDTQIKNDWLKTNLGLLDGESTGQHARSEKYMEELYYKYGDKYDSFGITGHSLGGNLGMHMFIHAPAEMRDKVDRCVSLDGPGFSDEYLEEHGHLIDKVSDRMDHYQWSVVSSLLNSVPGANTIVIEARDGKGLFSRHSIDHVVLDENGNVIKGDESTLSKIAGPLSVFFDDLGSWLDYYYIGYMPVLVQAVLLYKLVRDVAQVFYEVKTKVKERIESIYYDYIAPDVSGDYEIQCSAVGAYERELQNAQKQLDAVTDEIERIRRTWKNWTTSGAYYRSQLNIIKNGLESDMKVLSSLAKNTRTIVNAYTTAENSIRDLFFEN